MKKITYEKPSITIINLEYTCQILTKSGDPAKDVPWWDGEGGSRQYNGDWEEEDWEEEEETWGCSKETIGLP